MVFVLYCGASAMFIYYSHEWLRKEDFGFEGLLMMVFYFQLYAYWAHSTISPFASYQARFIALHELLFHYQDVDELNQNCVLETHRLDPTIPDNLKAWFILRIHMLEDSKHSSKISKAIA